MPFLSIKDIKNKNSFPYKVVNVASFESFKSKLGNIWEDKTMCFKKIAETSRQFYR